MGEEVLVIDIVLRKGTGEPVKPGDVLAVVPVEARLRIRVDEVRNGYIWGRECDGRGEAFGPELAFPPEHVGCEAPHRLPD